MYLTTKIWEKSYDEAMAILSKCSRKDLIALLEQNDKNGTYSDLESKAQGLKPATKANLIESFFYTWNQNFNELVFVGDEVMWSGNYGMDEPVKASVTSIELCKAENMKYGKQMRYVHERDLKRCVFNLSNNHWGYGHQVSIIKTEKVEDTRPPFAWKSHIRNMFDEVIQSNDKMAIFHKPFQITMLILGAAAKYAAETGDEKMIGYFARLALYEFSDPTNKEEFNQERTQYYIDKTLQ